VGHLLQPRKGWENERLAAFLLSRFSFIAHPASIAEDLGSDFFCTMFQLADESGRQALVPRSTFAIQIKSTADPFGVDNKVDYLYGLELPFFIGVVSQSPAEMTVYSAGMLPLLLSEHGKPERLRLDPCEPSQFDPDAYCEVVAPNSFRLFCPSVTTIRATDDRSALDAHVETLLALCKRTLANIATRIRDEHIYDVDGTGRLRIMAGPGSVKVFRSNLLQRLGEVFYNLEWTLKERPETFRVEEFRAFENLYHALAPLYGGSLPPYVAGPYASLRVKVDGFSA
jgi:hypothetical protein